MGCSESNTKNETKVVASSNNEGNKTSGAKALVASLAKPEVVFVVGGPGSGKGTQCDNIKQKFGYCHLSTGDLLRAEKDSGSELAGEINRIMTEGKLVPTEILIKLLKKAMGDMGLDKKFLIDGFPRGQENVDVWNQHIGDDCDLKFVLYFELDEDTMRARLLKRGETSGRADDNEASIIKRFQTFQDESVPIIKKFEAMGKLRTINSACSKDEVYEKVKALFC